MQASVAVACGIIGWWIRNSQTTREAPNLVLIDIINQKILFFFFFKSCSRQFHHLVVRVGLDISDVISRLIRGQPPKCHEI